MLPFRRAQPQPIGLDIGHDSIKMLQVELVDQSVSVRAAISAPVPAELRGRDAAASWQDAGFRKGLSQIIAGLLRRHPLRGRRIVTALPREILVVKNLRLPPMTPADLPAVVQAEARSILPAGVGEACIRYIPVGEVRQGSDVRQEVIVAAAAANDIDAFVELLHGCGAIVDSLDFGPCALFRTVQRFARRRTDEDEVHVLAEVGLRRTQVVIGHGHSITFCKSIDIGGAHLHRAIAEALGISLPEAESLRRRLGSTDAAAVADPVRQAVFDATRSTLEELGREISLCLRYHAVTFRGLRPMRVRLTGGEANDPMLRQVLDSSLTIPVEAPSPLSDADTTRIDDRCPHAWALAFGLALKRCPAPLARVKSPERPVEQKAQVVDLNRLTVDDPSPVEEPAHA